LRKLVSLVVATMAITAVAASAASAASSITYTGQGFNGSVLGTSKCDAGDNGGTGQAIPADGRYLLWVLNGSVTGPVTLHLPAPTGDVQMIKVGATWKYVSPYFTKAQLLGPPAVTATFTSGSPNNLVVSHGCARVSSRTTTVIHKAGGHDAAPLHMPLGSSVHDSATVTVDGNVAIPPLSKVRFDWYTASDCSGNVKDTVTKDAAALVDDALPEGPLHAGGYGYKATFTSGNTNLVGNSVGDCEPLTIDKADLGITTKIHDAGHNDITGSSVDLGSVVHDTATVTGTVADFPTGDVSFKLNDATAEKTDPAEAGFTASTEDSAPLAAGDYKYVATVASNDDYVGATGEPEELTVNKAQLEITTKIHDKDHGVVGGDTTVLEDSVVHDTATITGQVLGFDAPGAADVTFSLDSGAGFVDVLSDNGNVDDIRSVDSDPLAVGSYTYKARVAGNSNYIEDESPDEPLTVVTKDKAAWCSPGFWRNASDEAWALTGHAKTDLFNDTVVPDFYITPSDANPTLIQVLTTPGANTFGAAAAPFNINAFNATGAMLTDALPGYVFDPALIPLPGQPDNPADCPVSNGGVITP
jgi:hypothetical protein